MSNFTQVKWTYDPTNGIVHDDGKLIAEVAGAGGSNYRHARGEGNARLIAAAPEMYELLRVFADEPSEAEGRIYELCLAWHEARKLLARIDGKETAE